MVGVLQVMVYAGAIMVLFLFVIMFLNPAVLERARRTLVELGQRCWLCCSAVCCCPLFNNEVAGDPVAATELFGSPEMLAKSLFTDFVLPFEIASVVAAGRDRRRGGTGEAGARWPMVPLNYYLILSAVIFAIGVIGVLIRRNLIVVLMSIELMLNAVNLTFIAFSRYLGSMDGQVMVFFVMAVAAAEAVIGLAIIISVFRHRQSLDPQEMQLLKW